MFRASSARRTWGTFSDSRVRLPSAVPDAHNWGRHNHLPAQQRIRRPFGPARYRRRAPRRRRDHHRLLYHHLHDLDPFDSPPYFLIYRMANPTYLN